MFKNFKQKRFSYFLGAIYALSLFAVGLVLLGHASAWWLVAGIVWSKYIQLIGHSIGMHRYFSHRGFKTTPGRHRFIAWHSLLLGVGSPIQYAGQHRAHHKFVDTDLDWTGPKQVGALKTALGLWEFNGHNLIKTKGFCSPRDWIKDATCKQIHDNYYRVWAALSVITLLIDPYVFLFLLAFPSFFYHVELNIFINWTGHAIGYRNFNTDDTTANSQLVQWWTLGEGLHNNHHAYAHLYDFATHRGETDVSAWVIEKFFSSDPEYLAKHRKKFDQAPGTLAPLMTDKEPAELPT
jgi:stearoyl-CoA desaturase (delta-9 desaturase)